MQIEIINTGSELMLGRVLNTHQQWLCRQLADLGFIVTRQVAISDDGAAIQNAVRESLARAELIITTGGLGPTSDDITRNLIAQLLGKQLELNSEVLHRIEKFFADRKRRMPESTKVQAMVPAGATVLQNENGTAPGLVMEIIPSAAQRHDKTVLIMLPGPPRELRPMFLNQVIPLLEKIFLQPDKFACRTLKTTGLGESFLEEKLSRYVKKFVEEGIEIGYCARVGEVEVRIAARGFEADKKIGDAEKTIHDLLGLHIFGMENDSLESVIVRLLTERKQTLALAESCTGGFISHRITNVPGASAVFINGIISYSNDSKRQFIGVRAETLRAHGAVSERVAREMAEGARARSKTDYALAVTGIAGPDGGTEEKPVGTVWIALAADKGTKAQNEIFRYDRETFKFVASQEALDLLRRTILG